MPAYTHTQTPFITKTARAICRLCLSLHRMQVKHTVAAATVIVQVFVNGRNN